MVERQIGEKCLLGAHFCLSKKIFTLLICQILQYNYKVVFNISIWYFYSKIVCLQILPNIKKLWILGVFRFGMPTYWKYGLAGCTTKGSFPQGDIICNSYSDIAPMGIIVFSMDLFDGLFPLRESDSDSNVPKNGCRTHFLATSLSLSLCGNGT